MIPSDRLDELANRLREKSHKLTGQRQAILNLLHRETHLLSSKEICARLPQGNCNLATVYRSLHLLEEMGMVKRFDFGDGIARYELRKSNSAEDHLICTQCHCAVKVKANSLKDLEERITQQHGFRHVTHKLEFFGLCPRCAHAPCQKPQRGAIH